MKYTYYTQNAHDDVVNLTDFGVEQNIDDSDSNAFRYCGEYYDSETGTIYLRARYYDPAIGQFISRDSFAGKNEDPLSLNLFNYCANNPVYFKDFSGHWFGLDDAIAAGIGAIAGGVGQLASDLVESAITDDWKFSDWQTYTGAIVGGAIGGVCSLYVSPVAGAAIGAGASTLIGETLQYVTDAEEAPESYGRVLVDTGINCLFGAAFSKIPLVSSRNPAVYFSGRTYESGMNSLGILYAQTSSVRDTIHTITTNSAWANTTKKTIVNGIIDQVVSSSEESSYDAVKNILIELGDVKSNDSREVFRTVFEWAS